MPSLQRKWADYQILYSIVELVELRRTMLRALAAAEISRAKSTSANRRFTAYAVQR